jgi:hypothetical protein
MHIGWHLVNTLAEKNSLANAAVISLLLTASCFTAFVIVASILAAGLLY